MLFDLDDTLHDDTAAYRRAARRVCAEVSRERTVAAAALEDAYVEEIDRFWGGLSARDLSSNVGRVREQMWRRALERVGIYDDALARRSAADYNRYRREHFVLFPGALELLQTLRAQGKKLALVTNGFAETHYDKIAVLKLRDLLDEIFIADEVGMVKPDPRLFLRACEVLGVAPERSAMVGDRYERDVRGAAEAGLMTIWVNVRGEEVPAGEPPPDAICNDILGVGPILAGASVAAAHGS